MPRRERAGAETGDPTGEGGRLRGERGAAKRQARGRAERERQAGAPGHWRDRLGDLAGGDSRHGGSLCAARLRSTGRGRISRWNWRQFSASCRRRRRIRWTCRRRCGLARSGTASRTFAGGSGVAAGGAAAASPRRRRMQDHRQLDRNRRRRLARLDLGAAAADQPLIGGDQRHVGIDPDPADLW